MTPGQIAYQEDVRRRPTYGDGTPRKSWEELCDVARWSWEREPPERKKSRRPPLKAAGGIPEKA